MGSVIISPNDVWAGATGGWTTDAGASTGTAIAAAVADVSDSTYLNGPGSGNHIALTLSDPNIPPFATVTSLQTTVRAQGNNAAVLSLAYAIGFSRNGLRTFSQNEKLGSGIATRTYAKVTTSPDGPWTQLRATWAMLDLWAYTPIKVMTCSVEVFYNEAPVVVIDGPVTPYSKSNSPVITWQYSDPENSPQEYADVRVFTDAQLDLPGFDPVQTKPYWSTVQHSSNQFSQVGTGLAAGSWWAYVRASEQGAGQRYGDWSVYNFVISGSAPNTPGFSVAADSANRRVALTVTESDNLISYNQAGFEDTTNGTGWYSDSNATLAVGGSASAEAEGTRVLQVTAPAAALSRVRNGGPWSNAGYGATKNIAIDPSTPGGRVTNSGATDLTSASFTPPVGSRVYAFMSEDSLSGITITPTVTSSAGLTMTLISKVDGSTFANHVGGGVAVWVSSVVASAVAQTIKLTHHDSRERSLQVVVLTGVHATVPTGAVVTGGTSGKMTTSLTSTAAGSWTWGVWADSYANNVPTMVSGAVISTSVHDTQLTGATLRRAAVTSQSGTTVDMSDTSPLGGVNAVYAIFEVMPGTVPGVPSTSLAGIPVIAGQTYTKHGSVWMADNTAKTARIDHAWYDVSGTIIGAIVTGITGTCLTTTTMLHLQEVITAPAGAVCCVILPAITNPTLGEVAHWDRMGLVPGSSATWGRGGMLVSNALDCDDGSHQSSIGTWTVLPYDTWSNVSRVSNASVQSGWVLQTYVTAQPHTARSWTAIQPGIIAGQVYTFSCSALAAAGQPNGIITLEFFDHTGTILSSTPGSWVQLGTAAWQQLMATATAPPGATQFRCIVGALLTSTGAGSAVWWTRLSVDRAATPPLVWQAGPTAVPFPFVEYSDDGITWTEVRYDTLARFDPAAGMVATIYDYESPPGAARLYRASTAGLDYLLDPTGTVTVVSLPSDPLSATVTAFDWWLKDPLAPGTMLDVDIQGDLKWTRKRKQGSYSPLGRTRPVVVFDEQEGRESPVEIWLYSEADRHVMETMLGSGDTLLLQGDQGEQWYVMPESSSWTYLNAPGRLLGHPTYQITMTLIEVDVP